MDKMDFLISSGAVNHQGPRVNYELCTLLRPKSGERKSRLSALKWDLRTRSENKDERVTEPNSNANQDPLEPNLSGRPSIQPQQGWSGMIAKERTGRRARESWPQKPI